MLARQAPVQARTTRSSSSAKHEAIRVPPETWRGVWNDEPEDAEIVIVSPRIDDPIGDTENSRTSGPSRATDKEGKVPGTPSVPDTRSAPPCGGGGP